MTKKRQFCPQGHDTFQVGRDYSYRCLQCKREDAGAARRARDADAAAVRHAELVRQQAEAERRRNREHARKLRSRDPKLILEALIEERPVGHCQWTEDDPPAVCGRKARDGISCGYHNRLFHRRQEAKRKAQAAAHKAEVEAYKGANAPGSGTAASSDGAFAPAKPQVPDVPEEVPEEVEAAPDRPGFVPFLVPRDGTWYPVEVE